MIMKKNTLLIAVAATALAVGSGTAFAQAPNQGGQKSDSPAVQSNPASKNAPAEKIQGADQKGPANKAETPGQKMGQDLKSPNNKSTTGQAPSEPKAGQANERPNQKMGQDQKTDQKSPNNKNTTGQAPAQQTPTQQTTPRSDRANEPNRMNSGQTNERGGANVNERGANERGGAGVNERGTAETRGGSTNVNVTLSTEQRTKIHSIIVADRSAPRLARADFDVRVGVVVPRDKVKFVAVPSTIIEIQPAWRGFEYFLVGDEIVIVDPATLRIVAVIPA
jgi:hypothetical protein